MLLGFLKVIYFFVCILIGRAGLRGGKLRSTVLGALIKREWIHHRGTENLKERRHRNRLKKILIIGFIFPRR